MTAYFECAQFPAPPLPSSVLLFSHTMFQSRFSVSARQKIILIFCLHFLERCGPGPNVCVVVAFLPMYSSVDWTDQSDLNCFLSHTEAPLEITEKNLQWCW